MTDRFDIDVKAAIEKRQQELQRRHEERLRVEAERAERRAQNLERDLALAARAAERAAKRLQIILNGEIPPYLVRDWLLCDSWSPEDAMLLLVGLEPANKDRLHARSMRLDDHRVVIYEPDLAVFCTLRGLALWRDYSNYLPRWKGIVNSILRQCSEDIRLAKKIWASGSHPERPTPQYFIKWAISKGFNIPWLSWATEQGLIEGTPRPSDREGAGTYIGDTERASLQKQVAAIALVLAEKSGRYKNGDAPNGNQIAEAVASVLDALPDAKTRGVSSSAIRASIKAGMDLLKR